VADRRTRRNARRRPSATTPPPVPGPRATSRAADIGIAQSRQPGGLTLGQRFQVTAHHVDEHQLADAAQHAFAAHAALGLGQRRAKVCAQCAARVIADADHARQGRQQRVVGTRIATQEAAHEVRGRALVGAHCDLHRQASVVGHAIHRHVGRLAHVAIRGQHVGVAMRQQDDVARHELDRILAFDHRPTTSFHDGVIADEVIRSAAGKHLLHDSLALRRLRDPGSARVHVEKKRAGQAYRAQNVGKSIHKFLAGRMIMKAGRVVIRILPASLYSGRRRDC
jgi:hypothetical protein